MGGRVQVRYEKFRIFPNPSLAPDDLWEQLFLPDRSRKDDCKSLVKLLNTHDYRLIWKLQIIYSKDFLSKVSFNPFNLFKKNYNPVRLQPQDRFNVKVL